MSDRQQRVLACLQTAFPEAVISLEDESHLHVGHPGAQSGGSHFALSIQSPVFFNLSLVQRHQLIYQVLKDFMGQEIHALKINISIC